MAASELFKDVPEFVEHNIGESLLARQDALSGFRELGPPDLVHVVKSGSKATAKESGSYHYVSGVDVSSSASVAAYFHSLTNSIDAPATWLGGKGKPEYFIKRGCFAAYNAFSRVDVRVEVKMPGGVDAYIVDQRGERHPVTPRLWLEVYVSAMLRSILYADDMTYKLAGYRKLAPIKTAEEEQRFLRAIEECFAQGWQLGSDPEVQVATVVNNHLTSGIMKYFGESFRYQPAVNLFEKLLVKEGQVASLLAQTYIGMNEEVKAVQALHRAMHNFPQSYSLLHVQSDFLLTKGKADWAQKLAQSAVNCAPSEFITWAKLTEMNIEIGKYDEALLTLNSCPMFTFNERDLHRMPSPALSHLPMPNYVFEYGVLEPVNELGTMRTPEEENEADAHLLSLPAPALRGTFKEAYRLLAKLVSVIGWDELLRARGHVFVMEEEYRQAKVDDEESDDDTPLRRSLQGDENSTGLDGAQQHQPASAEGADEGASTRAVHSQQPSTVGGDESKKPSEEETAVASDGKTSVPESPVPQIRISTESEAEREGQSDKPAGETEAAGDATAQEAKGTDDNGEAPKSDLQAEPEGLEKPLTAAHSQTSPTSAPGFGDEPSTATSVNSSTVPPQTGTSTSTDAERPFSNKRLCERWLDNLFMVLYEDLRILTVWRAEMAHFKAQHQQYRKTATEWEILGDLALRLHRKEDAKEAYQRSLDAKFSAKAWLELLKMYVSERDIPRALNAAARIAAYNDRWYQESAFPSAVGHQLFRLIRSEGLQKVSYSLVSMRLPDPVLKTMQTFFAFAQEFRVEGSEL